MSTNILLITADDLNYNSTGIFGNDIPDITPNIDQLAGEGLRFRHSHVTIAVCQPSREVLMTGRYPHRNGALGFDPIDESIPTLQEQLQKLGYMNGIIGKEDHLAPVHKYCWDYNIRMMTEENGLGRDPKKYYHYAKEFFLKARQERRPFFLMANSHDPHRPFAGSRQERDSFGHNTTVTRRFSPEEVKIPGFLPDIPEVRQEISEYLSSVHRCDETVGEVLRALKETGFEENTIVMFLSDNGMAFPFAKTNCYLNSTRTPWIVRWPGRITPNSIDYDHFISGIDFMPTILDMIGLPPLEGMDGRSFFPILQGKKVPGRNNVFTVFNTTAFKKQYPMRCIQNKKYGYIFNAWSDQKTVFHNESKSGLTYSAMKEAAKMDEAIAERVRFFDYRVKEELYDFEKDPDALHNLIGNPEYSGIAFSMKEELLKMMEATEDYLVDVFKKDVLFKR